MVYLAWKMVICHQLARSPHRWIDSNIAAANLPFTLYMCFLFAVYLHLVSFYGLGKWWMPLLNLIIWKRSPSFFLISQPSNRWDDMELTCKWRTNFESAMSFSCKASACWQKLVSSFLPNLRVMLPSSTTSDNPSLLWTWIRGIFF